MPWSIEGSDIKTNIHMYRKPTYMDQYLQCDLHLPIAHKLSMVHANFHYVQTHITHDDWKKLEIEKNRTDLRRCGDPNWSLKEGHKKSTKKDNSKVKSKDLDSSVTPLRRECT